MRKGNLKKFIDKAKKIHGDKYSYDDVIANEPESVKSEITVICKKHGPFKTTFDSHVNKKTGCPICNRGRRRTNEEFIEECKSIHKDKNYDYSKTVYKTNKDKVTVICHEKNILGKEHGEFQIRADHFLHGHGCPYCAHRYLTTEEVIAMAKKKHGDKYDYSLLEYHNDNSERLPIICHQKDEDGNEHGIFSPIWSSHIAGVGCPKCNGGVKGNREDFIEKANKIHRNKYSYDNFVYVNARTDGIIRCPIHGDFMQTPYEHVKLMRGCPKCKSSKMEMLLINAFDKNNVDYVYQALTDKLGKQTFDFLIPLKKIYIECQGEQHFKPVNFGGGLSDKEMLEVFNERKRLDKEKYEYAIENGYDIIYYVNVDDFYDKGIDIYGGFYSDKIVFKDINDIIKYIKYKDIDNKNNILDQFRNDIKNISKDIICNGNSFKYRDYVIYLNSLEGNNREHINDIRRKNVERGHKVINIFEDEYEYHRDIVLSKIKHICGFDNGLKRIYGRKCSIVEIDKNEANKFLGGNHIQGFVASTVYLGAVYESNIVAVMSFLKDGDGMWNLTRFASLNGRICCGVGGKLFSYFVRNYNPVEVKSFADVRWTTNEDDNLYIKLGFKFDYKLSPEYRYYKNGETKERMHKFGFRKQFLHRKYGLPLSMTETQMTEALGYHKVWDCGLIKYVWKKS